jgi:hypothetical protein
MHSEFATYNIIFLENKAIKPNFGRLLIVTFILTKLPIDEKSTNNIVYFSFLFAND